MPIVLIIRHPFAVAASWLALGEDIDLGEAYLSQPDLAADFLHFYRGAMDRCLTPFERIVAAWCIEVGIPLSQFALDDIRLVYYEQLCMDPIGVLSYLAARTACRVDPSVCKVVDRPSRTTFQHERLRRNWIEGPTCVVESWRQTISAAQVRRGFAILEEFGMDRVYGDDFMPSTASNDLPAGLSSRPLHEAAVSFARR
jgi:hypothetical protein